jgi:hypothetical protein
MTETVVALAVCVAVATLPWPVAALFAVAYVGGRCWLGWRTGETQLARSLRVVLSRQDTP